MIPFYFGADPCPGGFFFFPHWWEYLNVTYTNSQCVINYSFPNDIWLIGMAVLDILLRLAGFVAVLSIIYSGIMYVTAVGQPDKAASARRRLYNSLIGLAIVLVATGFVAFLGNKIGG